MKNKIEDYRKKDDLELEKIIDEYSPYVLTIIKNSGINNLTEEDTEEILSDTFFILWKNRSVLVDDKILSSYIAGITRNLIKEKLRKIHINYDISDYENIIESNFSVDLLYEKKNKISEIEKVINNLCEDDIYIFKMYYYSSMKIKEIAKALNLSEFNIKTRLYRIRKKIRKNIEKGGYGDE